jgi:DNA-binding HxlR family transcriptional regulator
MAETVGGKDATPFVRAVAVLQEKWSLLIVNALLDGPAGFNELSRKVCGVCPATLSQRLSLLEDAGVVAKTVHSTMPPRTSYVLTPSGEELRPVTEAMSVWADRHLNPKRPCPLLAAERDCP